MYILDCNLILNNAEYYSQDTNEYVICVEILLRIRHLPKMHLIKFIHQ